eukprot:1194402-Prorocentrum_minimum.AAC.1
MRSVRPTATSPDDTRGHTRTRPPECDCARRMANGDAGRRMVGVDRRMPLVGTRGRSRRSEDATRASQMRRGSRWHILIREALVGTPLRFLTVSISLCDCRLRDAASRFASAANESLSNENMPTQSPMRASRMRASQAGARSRARHGHVTSVKNRREGV